MESRVPQKSHNDPNAPLFPGGGPFLSTGIPSNILESSSLTPSIQSPVDDDDDEGSLFSRRIGEGGGVVEVVVIVVEVTTLLMLAAFFMACNFFMMSFFSLLNFSNCRPTITIFIFICAAPALPRLICKKINIHNNHICVKCLKHLASAT